MDRELASMADTTAHLVSAVTIVDFPLPGDQVRSGASYSVVMGEDLGSV
jgi:hypothetical protein